MHVRLLRLAVFVAVLAVPAFAAASALAGNDDPWLSQATIGPAQQAGGTHEAAATAGGGQRIAPMVLWTVVGVAAGALVFTTLYMLKRRVGAFPENPDWIAPITIMYSKDSPAEGAFGDAGAHGHGDPHGAHH